MFKELSEVTMIEWENWFSRCWKKGEMYKQKENKKPKYGAGTLGTLLIEL